MLLHRLYNLFSSETRQLDKHIRQPLVYVEDKDTSQNKFKDSFLYVCNPGSLPPDMTVGAFFHFLGDVTHCPRDKKAEIFQFGYYWQFSFRFGKRQVQTQL